MERLRKGLSIFAAAALLAPAGGALAGRPVFQRHHENHERDDDRGGNPVKTSAGELTLRSRALLGKDGNTQLEISTAAFDTDGTPPGNISHVHVRAVDASGRDGDDDKDDKDGKEGKDGKGFRFRREYNHLRGGGYFTDTYPGLLHGLNLRIEAKARGSVHRDEVEAKWLDVVRYRPDLYVKLIDAPAKARVNSVVPINAIISEGMGETGGDTDCVLQVDGAQVADKGLLWVDAGGSSTCAFLYTFPTAGPHTITVRAQNGRPADYDESNNSLSQTITITQPFFAHYDSAVSETTTINNSTTEMYLIATSTAPDSRVVKNNTKVEQLRSFLGLLPPGVNPESIRVAYSDSSGGRALSSFDVGGLTLGPAVVPEIPGCSSVRSVTDTDAATGRTIFFGRCFDATTNATSTTVSVSYAATQTTAFSENFCRISGAGCRVGDFITTTVIGAVAPVQLADDYSASVVVDDAGTVFTAKPTMTLTSLSAPLNTITGCGVFNVRGKRCTTTTTGTSSKGGKVSVDNAE